MATPRRSSRRSGSGKRKLTAYNRFTRSYIKSHKGSNMADAAAAWHKHKAGRGSARRSAKRSSARRSSRRSSRKY